MIIPSFRPAISYKELNAVLVKALLGHEPTAVIGAFEFKFAEYLRVKHAISVPSGRWGLFYILQALGLKEGDEVILPAFSYFAVPAAIVKLGLRPVFVDINSDNLNINAERIKESLTEKTRVIIPTHLSGLVCNDLDKILDIARKNNVIVIEDCAQSLGAEYKGRKVGSLGDFSYFSFNITKNFTTLGAGMLATSDDRIAERIRRGLEDISPLNKSSLLSGILKGYAMRSATSVFLFPLVYCAMRMFDSFGIDVIERIFHEKETLLEHLPKDAQLNRIQARLGIIQLGALDIRNGLRGSRGMELHERIKSSDSIQVPRLESNAKNIFSNFPVLVKNKKIARKALLKKGIDTAAGHMRDCSRLEIFKDFARDCPNASRVQREVIYLPVYPELKPADLAFIAKTIGQIDKSMK